MMMVRPRIALVGCVEFSLTILRCVMAMPDVEVAGVVTRRASRVNADFASLEPSALEQNLSVYVAQGRDDDGIELFLRDLDVTLGLCVGWPFLLPPRVLQSPRRGFIGYHPSALPSNRGRHPLIWALALGLDRTGSSFFLMESGADSGPILDQEEVSIALTDDARSLYNRVAETAVRQLERMLPEFFAGSLQAQPQESARATAWRKRSPADGRIDWRMGYQAIDCLVRALRPPYPGATVVQDGRDVCVWRVSRGPQAPDNLEPGLVLLSSVDEILVKCWGGTIRLLEHDFDPLPMVGAYLGGPVS